MPQMMGVPKRVWRLAVDTRVWRLAVGMVVGTIRRNNVKKVAQFPVCWTVPSPGIGGFNDNAAQTSPRYRMLGREDGS
ncbi:hypothetical protein GE21DRAFT_1340200 [Neurospora crassa]|nr:hypothetical protein GE21DRAFT_1340200 [Neurospora crassa]